MSKLAINGGPALRTHPYPPWPVVDDRDLTIVSEVVRSGRWGGYPEPGPKAVEFERRFAEYQGARHGVLMANGSVTMEVALKALGIGWGDEVIVPALTFAATAYAAMAAGAVPVFVDVVPETWTIDPDQVEAAITARTRAVMPVHLGHVMADMDRITAIANRHSLAIVEDCAHAHGQRWRGTGAGCFGEFGSFSHQSSKTLTAGEGGSLLTSDDELGRLAHSLIDCGRPKDRAENGYTFGVNYRLGELHAALLCAAMNRFPTQQQVRERYGTLIEALVREVPGVRALSRDERITRWSFYRFIVAIEPDAFAGRTNAVVCEALEAEGVGAWSGYEPMSNYQLFRPARSRIPVAVEFAERLDPSRMSFPIAEAAGLREGIYIDENVFRAGRKGVQDAVEAIAKVQRHALELPKTVRRPVP